MESLSGLKRRRRAPLFFPRPRAREPAGQQFPRRHIPALDALRGFAVLAVMVYHFGGGLRGPASAGTSVVPAIHLGARGVSLFFVLSGFLITGILFDAKESSGYFRNFYIRRSLRIFPLYYGVLLVALIVWPWAAGGTTWQREAAEHSLWLWLYGSNLLLAWKGAWSLGAFDHFWSLAVEEQFYLVWPVIIFCLSRRGAMLACGGLFVTALVSRAAWSLAGGSDVACYTFTLFRADALSAGAWLALAARGQGGLASLVPISRWILAATFGMLGIVVLCHWKTLPINDSLWALLFGALLTLMVEAAPGSLLGRMANFAPLHWFGKYSYGMYVFSTLLVGAFATLLTAGGMAERVGSAYWGQWIYLLTMGMITVAVSYASWHLFERWFVALKSRFSD